VVYSLGSCIDSLDDSLIRGVDMNRAKDITIVLLFIAVVYLVATRDWSNDVPEVSQSPDVLGANSYSSCRWQLIQATAAGIPSVIIQASNVLISVGPLRVRY